MTRRDYLKSYGERVGYTDDDLSQIPDDDPRARHIERLSQAASQYSIEAEVVETRHCNSGYQVGDTFVLDMDGNFLSSKCPKKLCVYLIAQFMVPVALINERISEELDPNRFHFMRRVRCPDVGVECTGYGETILDIRVIPRKPR
jgi:uncharacterized repeat protein (TIGR04076 family)